MISGNQLQAEKVSRHLRGSKSKNKNNAKVTNLNTKKNKPSITLPDLILGLACRYVNVVTEAVVIVVAIMTTGERDIYIYI